MFFFFHSHCTISLPRSLSHSLTLFLEDPPGDQFEGGEDGPFLLEGGGVGGHGAWGDASDVCVVPPAGHKEHRPANTSPKHLEEVEESRKHQKKKMGMV